MAETNCSCSSTKDTCQCTSNCVRHGKCDECRAHHASKNSLTNCQKREQK